MMGTVLRALIVLGAVGAAQPASAAVLACVDQVAFKASGETEVAGRKAALTGWTEHVTTAHGIAFTRWLNAWERRITCVQSGGGLFSCTASGRPCRIEQAPGREFMPFRRGNPT